MSARVSTAWVAVIALMVAMTGLALTACRGPGTIDIEVSLPLDCPAPTHVGVYLMRGALCDECSCGECLAPCDGGPCTLGCDGGFCTLEEFEAGVELAPTEAGNYAVVYQFVTIADDGRIQELSVACVDGVQLDKDGTDDDQRDVAAMCCSDE